MKKITLKDVGLYAVMGLLTTLLSSGIVGLISPFAAKLLPQVMHLRFVNNCLILIHAILYPLIWSRRQCVAMMRGESGADEKVLVKRFMREYIFPQVAVQFAMYGLICILAFVTKQTSPVSNLEMYMWSLGIPIPLLLSCRIVARREIRSILQMRDRGAQAK